ncbi:MAG: hypothetical protein V1870_00320 [Candidatus Aenigmatarchaeota archaeon]
MSEKVIVREEATVPKRVIVYCSPFFYKVPDFLKELNGGYDQLLRGDNVLVFVYNSMTPEDKLDITAKAGSFGYRILNQI